MITIAQQKQKVYLHLITMGISIAIMIVIFQIDFILKGVIISFLALIFLVGLYGLLVNKLNYCDIEINGPKICIKKYFPSKHFQFLKKEILFWTEEKYSFKSNEWFYLFIHTDNHVFKIASEYYKNYNAIKRGLTNGICHNESLETKKRIKSNVIRFLLLSILSFASVLQAQFDILKINQLIIADEVHFYKDSIQTSPKLTNYSKGGNVVIFKTLQSKFEIKVDAKIIEEANLKQLLLLPSNAVLTFGISHYDFESKVKESLPISFYERHFTIPNIKLLSLSDGQHHYLNIDETNQARTQANKIYWIWAIIVFIGALFFLIKALCIRWVLKQKII